jgi:hypothetical protein
MKRWVMLAMVVVLIGAMSAGALADDSEATGDDAGSETTKTLSDAQLFKARMIADYFAPSDDTSDGTAEGEAEEPTETSCEPAEPVEPVEAVAEEAVEGPPTAGDLCVQIVALRTGEDTVGWGAIYKLMLLAQAWEMPLDEVVTTLRENSDDGGWGFGKSFKQLRDDDYEWGDTHTNLGQLNKETKAEERAERKAAKKGDG